MSDKEQLRQKVWELLSEKNAGAFPFPLEGRIPNFKGAHDAARRLSELPVWRRAQTIKSNPDSPQLKVRELALSNGKRLFMTVPRLRARKPFREIILDRDTKPRKAVSISGSKKYGKPRSPRELPEIDLIIAGSVAVHPDGRRLGKGGGYSDLEFALAREAGKITDQTVIATTVHPLQVTEQEIPFEAHDIPVDYIVTPEQTIKANTGYERPRGIVPQLLSRKYREEIPVLKDIPDRPD